MFSTSRVRTALYLGYITHNCACVDFIDSCIDINHSCLVLFKLVQFCLQSEITSVEFEKDSILFLVKLIWCQVRCCSFQTDPLLASEVPSCFLITQGLCLTCPWPCTIKHFKKSSKRTYTFITFDTAESIHLLAQALEWNLNLSRCSLCCYVIIVYIFNP